MVSLFKVIEITMQCIDYEPSLQHWLGTHWFKA